MAFLEERAERQVLPVEADRPADRAVRVDHARGTDPDAEEGARGLTPDVVDELVDELDGLLAVTALELAGAFRGELAAQVREGGGEGALAEVERDDGPRVVLQGDEGRLLAAGARAAADVLARPSRSRSATSSPTLVLVRPVRRAMSARLTAQVVERAEHEGRVVGAGLGMGRLGREFGACHGWV